MQARFDRALVSGVAWTATAKWVGQVLSWASTLVVARLLSPDDYGLVGMATVYMGLVTMISEFGVGTTVVTQRSLTDSQLAQMNGVALLFGLSGFAISWAAAFPVASFFHTPELRPVVVVLAVTFVIYGLRTIPLALLQRDLQFKLVAATESLQVIVQALSTVSFALLGMGYWALVFGPIVGASAGALVACSLRFQRFAVPKVELLKGALTFSGHVVVSRLSWYVFSNADFLVAGRVLGKAALGAYTVAWALASMPIMKVVHIFNQVTYPLFSAVQKDRDAIRRYFLNLTEVTAFIVFPLAFGLAIVAGEFIPLALGQKWNAVVLPLQILAVYASFRAITPMLAQILFAVGESRFVMNLSLIQAVLLPGVFYVGSQWGISGIAVAWMVVHPWVSLVAFRRVFRRIGLTPGQYFAAIWPALGSILVMVSGVLLCGSWLPPDFSLALTMGVKICAGVVSYGSALLVFHRARLGEVVRFIQRARS